jgi:hypothetical protein
MVSAVLLSRDVMTFPCWDLREDWLLGDRNILTVVKLISFYLESTEGVTSL